MYKDLARAIQVVDHDSLIDYAEKYNIPLDYAQTIYNMMYLDDPQMIDGKRFEFRMPATQKEVNNGKRTGELIQVEVSNYPTHGMGNVTWIGIEGVNLNVKPAAQNVEEPIERKAGESKLDICRRIYDSNQTRKQNIDNFRYHAGCTVVGAATYYSKIKNS